MIGINNVAIGDSALYANTGGSGNIAIGTQSLSHNISSVYNTAIGYNSLYFSDGNYNTALGYSSLRGNTSGANNTSVGFQALYSNSTGGANTSVGNHSMYFNSTGYNNTAIGSMALDGNTAFYNVSGVGFNAQITNSNQVQLGDSTTSTYIYGASTINRSDIRDKADVRDTVLGLPFINALRPVDYRWDMREDYKPLRPTALAEDASDDEKAAYEVAKDAYLTALKFENLVHDGSKKRTRYHHGLIAQEIKEVIDASGVDFGGFQDHKVTGGEDVLSVGYTEFIAPMIKAIQELSARVVDLEGKLAKLSK